MEVMRGLRNSILPTLTFGSETWTWNQAQQSRLCAVEMSCLIGFFFFLQMTRETMIIHMVVLFRSCIWTSVRLQYKNTIDL